MNKFFIYAILATTQSLFGMQHESPSGSAANTPPTERIKYDREFLMAFSHIKTQPVAMNKIEYEPKILPQSESPTQASELHCRTRCPFK